MPHRIDRRHYADLYGPTTGDRLRLGDTGPGGRSGGGCDRLRRRMQVRRRQGPARRHGAGGGGVGRARPRLRDHQRPDRRLDGHPESRRRHQERAHRGHRQGRQPRRHGRGERGSRGRGDHGGHRGRGDDSDRRRHRRPRALHLSPAGVRGGRQRRDDIHRRRDRTGHRHQGDDVHAGQPAHPAHAAGERPPADELRLSRQRQHVPCRRDSRSRSGAAPSG